MSIQNTTTENIKPFRLYSCKEVLDLPPMQWLIESILPVGGFGVLYGSPGDGKSFLALSWATAISLGKPWLEKYEVAKGTVLYIYAEGATGLPSRIRALIKHYEIQEPNELFFITQSVNFRDKADFDRLCVTLKQLKHPPACIIIDTLSRCLSGGDDNSSKEISEFISRVDKIRQETNSFVLVVHHARKNDKEERGSSALRGAADVMLRIEKKNLDEIRLVCSKQKDGGDFPAILLRLQSINLAENSTSAVIVESDFEIIPSLKLEGREKKALLCIPSDGAACTEWMKISGMEQSTFYRARDELVKRNLVYKIDRKRGKYYLTDDGKLLSDSFQKLS